MSTLGIVGSLVILVLGLLYMFYPMFVKAERLGVIAQTQRGRDELLVRYERVVSAIRDLDDDFATGKVNEDEYRHERDIWARRGVELLKALEAAGISITEKKPRTAAATANEKQAHPPAKEVESEFDDAIEEAISKYVSAMSEQR